MADVLAPGTKVEVRNGFDGRWSKGFEICDADDDGYRLRRLSDGTVLPRRFTGDLVRRERRGTLWWV